MNETLRQIATTPGGVEAGNLMSKKQKEEASDMGFVWPKFGGIFRLTPAGARHCREHGIEPAPFAVHMGIPGPSAREGERVHMPERTSDMDYPC